MSPAYIFYGGDDFSIKKAVDDLKQDLGPKEFWDVNITNLSAGATSCEEIIALGSTIPFMAPARMVVVEGLLSKFDSKDRRRSAKGQDRSTKGLGPWLALADGIPQLPPSTILVFLDHQLEKGNTLLKSLKPVAKVHEFPVLQREELRSWINERMINKNGKMSQRGLRLLAELVGGNLWALDSELEKLQLYVGNREVSEEDVQLLVSRFKDASIFTLVDAMMEGRQSGALRELKRLIDEGSEPLQVLGMIVRQIRLVLLAVSLAGEGLKETDLSRRLGNLHSFVLKKVQEQSKLHSRKRLIGLYRQLLDADTAIKTGVMAPDVALDLLVSEVSRVGS